MEDKLFKIIIALIIGVFVTFVSSIVGLCVVWHTYLYAPVVETTISGNDNIAGTTIDNSNLVDK